MDRHRIIFAALIATILAALAWFFVAAPHLTRKRSAAPAPAQQQPAAPRVTTPPAPLEGLQPVAPATPFDSSARIVTQADVDAAQREMVQRAGRASTRLGLISTTEEASTGDGPACRKTITVTPPHGSTGVVVVSDDAAREESHIIDAAGRWTISVQAECARVTRNFAVRFSPSGATYSEASGQITITDPPPTRRRAVRP